MLGKIVLLICVYIIANSVIVSAGGGKKEHIHFKIHIPEIKNKHTHTVTIYKHHYKPKAEPPKEDHHYPDFHAVFKSKLPPVTTKLLGKIPHHIKAHFSPEKSHYRVSGNYQSFGGHGDFDGGSNDDYSSNYQVEEDNNIANLRLLQKESEQPYYSQKYNDGGEDYGTEYVSPYSSSSSSGSSYGFVPSNDLSQYTSQEESQYIPSYPQNSQYSYFSPDSSSEDEGHLSESASTYQYATPLDTSSMPHFAALQAQSPSASSELSSYPSHASIQLRQPRANHYSNLAPYMIQSGSMFRFPRQLSKNLFKNISFKLTE